MTKKQVAPAESDKKAHLVDKMSDSVSPAEILPPGAVETALGVLLELATDTSQSGAVRSGAAKSILSAGVQLAGVESKKPRSAGEMSLGDLEAEIAATKRRLRVVDPE